MNSGHNDFHLCNYSRRSYERNVLDVDFLVLQHMLVACTLCCLQKKLHIFDHVANQIFIVLSWVLPPNNVFCNVHVPTLPNIFPCALLLLDKSFVHITSNSSSYHVDNYVLLF